MDKIYVLMDYDGLYYCGRSLSLDWKTKLLGLAYQFRDRSTAETVAKFHNMYVCDLTPVPVI